MEEDVCYCPIGKLHSPHKRPKGTPIQPSSAEGVEGQVEIFPNYRAGLEDLGGFSHVILIYHFHLAGESTLKVKPYMDDEDHGVFATRGPARPNPVGISNVRLKKIEEGILYLEDVDILDGTPVLDVKPHVVEFDQPDVTNIGWLGENVHRLEESEDDGRFAR
ncbi:tRNA (N6-threonylcarbamoyladenosine(37)-N6)-methyltransferase TrmO [Candidatus Bipolaricaulota bacterium]|nr:tRNA (N6-threonylcarbamoyladenosine(37)-N6)-methyltransferase TrmO [Candidatus Bipolaricaulota bacterium]